MGLEFLGPSPLGSPVGSTHTPSRGSRHRSGGRSRRRSGARIPVYARIAIPILLLALFGRLAWQGMRTVLHRTSSAPAAYGDSDTQPNSTGAPPGTVPWQRDFMDSLASGVRDGKAGDLSAAEIDVDRAESFVTAARLEARDARPEFFTSSLGALDTVAQQAPQNHRLFDHVTLARVSLAAFRSSLEPSVAPDAGRIVLGAPRELLANSVLNPASAGGRYLDATLMPDMAEILLPPSTRSFADNTSVEHLTIAGAAQTLDGIRWRNVTFVGTRLRYESGELDLQNVHFVRCRFGFSSDDRGARLATAIALSQTSIGIQ